MSEVRPSNYIMGIVIFTLVVACGVGMISEFRAKKPTFVDDTKFEEFNNTFNVMEEANTQVDSYQTNIESSEDVDFGVFGVLNALIRNSWQVLRNIFGGFSFMDSLFTNAGKMFGIPTWVATSIISLITIMFAFAIFSAIFQRKL